MEVMKLTNYELIIKDRDQYYYVQLRKSELDFLQKSGPYELDRKVWRELENQELPVRKGIGNYIESVL
jgi:hypothetical protein